MKARITETEKKVYEHIKKSLQQGYAPTVREICAGCGFKSTSTAHRAIKSLSEKGYLEKHDKLNRAIRLAGRKVVKVPLIEKEEQLNAASIDQADTFIDFNPPSEYTGELFAVTADEDIPSAYVRKGDIIVAETTGTKISVEKGGIAVVAQGAGILSLKQAVTNGAMAIGKVVAIIRYV